MKTAKLGRILEDLGYVTEDEVRAALRRQRIYGGRIGENLVALGHLTSSQLTRALARQYGLPWRSLALADVPPELRDHIPEPGRAGSIAIPVRWSESTGELVVALNDPEDEESLRALREAFDARTLTLEIAPDQDLREVFRACAADRNGAEPGGIVLPELFAPAEVEERTADEPGPESGAPHRTLMITSRAHHRNFLPTIFSREGRELIVAGDYEEVVAALTERRVDSVLVDAERASAFRTWLRDGDLPNLPAAVGTFSSVSEALLANPVPYAEMIRSLRSAVEALAESRTRGMQPPPPYGLLARDVARLAELDGLNRLAVDGLYLAVHLLVPPRPATGGADAPPPGPFADFARSREIAVRLRFPWPIEEVLDACFSLFLGSRAPEPLARFDPEIIRAARILALVWFQHIHAPAPEADARHDAARMRAVLRRVATRLATIELAEKYLHVIEERWASGDVASSARVLLVGGDRVADLGARLARSRITPVATRDLADAQAMAEREPPEAIIVDRDAVPGQVDHFARIAKLNASPLLYVITDATDPAVTLGLLDSGADDVFTPPHDFELVAARVVRAISSRSKVRADTKPRGDFSANFRAFSFLDLAQALGHGRKSVRIELRRISTGEQARLFLDGGHPVHAVCGDIVGPEAVYRVITWEDDGEFTVFSETNFPEPTIDMPLESLIMEGCRRLDEMNR